MPSFRPTRRERKGTSVTLQPPRHDAGDRLSFDLQTSAATSTRPAQHLDHRAAPRCGGRPAEGTRGQSGTTSAVERRPACGASWIRTSNLTPVRAGCCRGICAGHGSGGGRRWWPVPRPSPDRLCSAHSRLVTNRPTAAGLVVVDDEGWWERFGHLVESNWEAERVNRHSTLDTAGLEALVGDPRWGNESLFCLLQGLRRLSEVGHPNRIAVPTIEAAT